MDFEFDPAKDESKLEKYVCRWLMPTVLNGNLPWFVKTRANNMPSHALKPKGISESACT